MPADGPSAYSAADRLLHRLAFSSPGLPQALADIEDRLYAKQLGVIAIHRPLFVTSLPRAGTTLLTEVIGSLHEFAAHTYREMPFLACPLLWEKISRPFRRESVARERAHGDGMQVGFDSVEAFEEALWHAFWPSRYQPDRIVPWGAQAEDESPDFDAFFRNHLRKLILLRRGQHPEAARYLSKNNGNVARTARLVEMFPDAIVLVPFRDPVDHVGSLLHQHRNFSAIHRQDAFARQYMRDIGHFDFGANLKPIDFDGWLGTAGPLDPMTGDYWLRYWCATFRYLLANRPANLQFLSYERCCAAPPAALERLAVTIDATAQREQLLRHAPRFRAPRAHDEQQLGLDPALLRQARELHGRLLAVAAV
jgi:hypothetical protein